MKHNDEHFRGKIRSAMGSIYSTTVTTASVITLIVVESFKALVGFVALQIIKRAWDWWRKPKN